MNKLFTKIVGVALGASMAVGVGVAVASNTQVHRAKADDEPDIILTESTSGASYSGTNFNVSGGLASSSYFKLGSGTLTSKNSYDIDSTKTISYKIKTRKFGGPSAAQAVVNLYLKNGSTELATASFSPSNTSLNDYTGTFTVKSGDFSSATFVVQGNGKRDASKGVGISSIEFKAFSSSSGPKKLATPDPQYNDSDNQVEWADIPNASSYQVSVNDESHYEEKTSPYKGDFKTGTQYTVYVKAIGDGTNYTTSDSGSVTFTVPVPFESKTFVQCTSTDDLEVGANYIFTNGISGSVKTMSTESNGNNRKVTDVTVADSKISSTESTLVLSLGGEEGAWTFYTTNYLGTKGYFASNGTSNHLKVQETAGEATIAFNDGAAVITLGPSTTNNLMRYNSNSSLFSCYTGGQQPIYLWKEEADLGNLTGISVKTAPTKVTYEENEYFDPTDLVITRTYEYGSNTYSYNGHESEFSFSPSLDTKLKTSDVSVSITYGGKSTTQAITVNQGAVYTSIDVTGGSVTSGYKGEATVTCKAVVNGTGGPDQTVSWYVTSTSTYDTTTSVEGVASIDTNTGAVTFLDNGTVYVWAYSQKGDLHNTVTATASASNLLDKPGSKDNPYTVAQAINAVVSEGEVNGVYAKGIVTNIDTAWSDQYKNISFDIKDVTSDTAFLRAFRCESGEADASQVAVGDSVAVKGNLIYYTSQSIYEFSAGCSLEVDNKPVGHHVSVSTPDITLSTTEIGDYGVVTLTTAQYKKAVVTNVSNADAEWNHNTVTLSNVTDNVLITATVEDASIASIELSGQTKKYDIDSTFSFDGTVTAVWDDWSDPSTREVVSSGYTVTGNVDTSKEGTYTVTVSYQGCKASYQVTVAEQFDITKGEYHLLTSNDLSAGDHIVIGALDTSSGKTYSGSEMAMHSLATNNVPAKAITVNERNYISSSKSDLIDIELVTGATENSFALKVDDDLYLKAGDTSHNYLQTTSTIDASSSFALSYSEDVWSIVCQASSGRNVMQYNPNITVQQENPLFSCYASATQTAIKVYKFVSYSSEALGYAELFLKANGSSFATCSATRAAWSTLNTEYGKLTDGAKALFVAEDHISASTYSDSTEISVKHAVCRYDDAVIKYEGLRGDNEFMGRVNAGKLPLGSNALLISPIVNNGTLIVVVIVSSFVTVTAIGGYFFIRRRKKQY